jgi:exonuclease SbcC
MRPLKLALEGFTCFRDKQELDLSELKLFAIAGPTGAGKSSLLDAMTFALYGRVPRLKGKPAEMVSLGRDRLAVTFEFASGGRTFRLARTLRRARGADAQLDELLGSVERPLAGGVREVDAAIERILGLPYEAFTQAVVLPQGEFAHFLKSEPREQREILRELLRLQVYERMREHAANQARDLGIERRGLEARIGQDYAGATPAALAQLEERARASRSQLESLAVDLDARRREHDQLRVRRAHTQDLEAKGEQLAALRAREGDRRTDAARLEAARRASPLLPLIESAAGAAERARAKQASAAEAEARVRAAEQHHAAAARALGARSRARSSCRPYVPACERWTS